jgi:[ribosomal protein S5]-alanine N-acetyltransferase
MNQPELRTARLVLRPFVLADGPTVQRLAGAWEVVDTTLNIPHPYPDGGAEQWIGGHAELFAAGSSVIYAITLAETGELCGSTGLHITQRDKRAEIGYWLGQPYWGQGYTSEAAAALLGYGFTTLGLNRIYATHFVRNPASGRVMQKIGMRFEGTMRQHYFARTQFEDVHCYGILREEWG